MSEIKIQIGLSSSSEKNCEWNPHFKLPQLLDAEKAMELLKPHLPQRNISNLSIKCPHTAAIEARVCWTAIKIQSKMAVVMMDLVQLVEVTWLVVAQQQSGKPEIKRKVSTYPPRRKNACSAHGRTCPECGKRNHLQTVHVERQGREPKHEPFRRKRSFEDKSSDKDEKHTLSLITE